MVAPEQVVEYLEGRVDGSADGLKVGCERKEKRPRITLGFWPERVEQGNRQGEA